MSRIDTNNVHGRIEKPRNIIVNGGDNILINKILADLKTKGGALFYSDGTATTTLGELIPKGWWLCAEKNNEVDTLLAGPYQFGDELGAVYHIKLTDGTECAYDPSTHTATIPVCDNLTTAETSSVLSAKQGNALKLLIEAEASRATSAETTLQTNINTEAATRAAADTAEQTARVAADDTLQDNIDAEETARIAADAALEASKQNKIFIQPIQPTTFVAGDIWYDLYGVFNITNTLTHCTGNVPTTINEGGSVSFTVTAASGYVLPNNITVTGATYTWSKSTGTVTISNPVNNVQVTIVSDAQEYLCFTAATANSTITLGQVGTTHWSGSSSLDAITWTPYTIGTTGAITLTNVGDKVYFKGTFSDNDDQNNHLSFSMTGSINASNSIMSMCCGDETNSLTIPYECVFKNLFTACGASLLTCPTLPAMNLKYGCYAFMFKDCTAITVAPDLPAKVSDDLCYYSMFKNCTALTTATVIELENVAYFSCGSMFYGCTNLANIPNTFKFTTVGECGCYQMYYECRAIVTAPNLPATTLGEYCYYDMFMNCKALRNCPTYLPATTIPKYAYYGMFSGCAVLTVFNSILPTITSVGEESFGFMFNDDQNLTTVTNHITLAATATNSYHCLFQNCRALTNGNISITATTAATNCCNHMFYNCYALTVAPELQPTTLSSYCYQMMFYGCTSLVNPPELNALTMAAYCYYRMFYGCTSLVTPPRLPATTLAEGCYASMFYFCDALNSINVLPVLQLQGSCYDSMYAGCGSLKMNLASSETFTYTWSIPAGAIDASASRRGMLSGTGGTFVGTPDIGGVLYTDHPPIE